MEKSFEMLFNLMQYISRIESELLACLSLSLDRHLYGSFDSKRFPSDIWTLFNIFNQKIY